MAGSLSNLDKVELTGIEIELSRINSRDRDGQDLDVTLGELRRCEERINFLIKRAKGAWDAEDRT